MANINTIETESIQVGTAAAPPTAAVDIWPSLDPTALFTAQSWGVSNFIGIHNQVGVHNGIGAHLLTGLTSLLGFKTGLGGKVDAEPSNSTSAVQLAFSSPAIIQTTPLDSKKLTQNGVPVELSSDIKNKINIKPLENSLEKILSMRGVEYDRTDGEIHEVGLIAQEVEEVIPSLVVVDNTDTKLVKYKNLTAVLLEAIKEQQEQINSLKETVQELSTKIAECCP